MPRLAWQSARELHTNNMHLSLCIPNSDCRRLPAKEVLRLAEESCLLSLIMFGTHSVETAVTPGRAFVPTWKKKKTLKKKQHVAEREREREERNPLSCQVVKQVRRHTRAAGNYTVQVNALVKLLLNKKLFFLKISISTVCADRVAVSDSDGISDIFNQ